MPFSREWNENIPFVTTEVKLGSDELRKIKVDIRERINTFVPIGIIVEWPAETVPDGWMECDGSAISRVTYADLFAVIGETWGAGDGSTTFNVPDLRGYFLRSWDNGAGVDPDAVEIVTTGDTTNGDATLSNIADDMTYVKIGSTITGTGIPAGTKVLSITDESTLEMTEDATADGTGVDITIDSNHVGTEQIDSFAYHRHGGIQNQDNPYFQSLGYSCDFQTTSTGGSESRPVNKTIMYIIRTDDLT